MIARVRAAVDMVKGGVKSNGDVSIGIARSFVYSGHFGMSALLVQNGYVLTSLSKSVQSKDIGWTSTLLCHKFGSVASCTKMASERCTVDRTAQDPSRVAAGYSGDTRR